MTNYPAKTQQCSSEVDSKFKLKKILNILNIVGYEDSQKLLIKYGDVIELAIEKIGNKRKLQKILRNDLGSYFPRIVGAWEQYREGEIDRTSFVICGILTLRKKFIDIFTKDSQEVLKVRRRNVYLTLNGIFVSIVSFCVLYFLLLMPVDVSDNPDGNFIFPGPENFEWIFTMIMSIIMIILFGYIASTSLSRLTIRLYVRSAKKNQKLGLVPIENLFGKPLYKKLLFRALISGFLVYNVSLALASNPQYITFMRSVNPSGAKFVPDPELMIQSMWISLIPVILLLVPIWLMMDLGVAKTRKVRGFELESVNLAGSKLYRFIKGYAGITFTYNLIILTFIWATQDVPGIRVFMRLISPLIVISFSFPLVVIIDHNNEMFKRKLWSKLTRYDINRTLEIEINEKKIANYEEI